MEPSLYLLLPLARGSSEEAGVEDARRTLTAHGVAWATHLNEGESRAHLEQLDPYVFWWAVAVELGFLAPGAHKHEAPPHLLHLWRAFPRRTCDAWLSAGTVLAPFLEAEEVDYLRQHASEQGLRNLQYRIQGPTCRV